VLSGGSSSKRDRGKLKGPKVVLLRLEGRSKRIGNEVSRMSRVLDCQGKVWCNWEPWANRGGVGLIEEVFLNPAYIILLKLSYELSIKDRFILLHPKFLLASPQS
jgi:hypothetical protein